MEISCILVIPVRLCPPVRCPPLKSCPPIKSTRLRGGDGEGVLLGVVRVRGDVSGVFSHGCGEAKPVRLSFNADLVSGGFSLQLHFPLVAMLTFCKIIRKRDHQKF